LDPDRTGRRRPKRLEERYEALAGSEEERLTLYVFRRRFQMGVNEVRSLPWWEKRLLLEGLNIEFPDPDAPDEVIDATSPEGLAASGLGFGVGTV
jgi:hypothetical protein